MYYWKWDIRIITKLLNGFIPSICLQIEAFIYCVGFKIQKSLTLYVSVCSIPIAPFYLTTLCQNSLLPFLL